MNGYKRGKKTPVYSGFQRVSYTTQMWRCLGRRVGGRKKKFPFTVTPLCCSESCRAEMQTRRPPLGVCNDCVVLLLHWALGSAEWAEGQRHREGDDPWASCHTSNTEAARAEGKKFSRNSFLHILLYTGQHIDTAYQWHFYTCRGECPGLFLFPGRHRV